MYSHLFHQLKINKAQYDPLTTQLFLLYVPLLLSCPSQEERNSDSFCLSHAQIILLDFFFYFVFKGISIKLVFFIHFKEWLLSVVLIHMNIRDVHILKQTSHKEHSS